MTAKSKVFSTLKAVFRSIGLELSFAQTVSTERNALRSLLKERTFNFVVDVGANSGQYGVVIRSCGYRGPILSFEPLAAAHAKLVARAAQDDNWKVAPRTALGASATTASINVAGNSVSSSLLDMNDRHIGVAPHSASVGTEEIRVIALDDCIGGFVGPSTGGLLKLDAQGYELEILRGARRSLSQRIDVVQTELSLVELYNGQPLMLEVCNFLAQYGLTLHSIIPGLKDPASGRLLQFDGIFSKP